MRSIQQIKLKVLGGFLGSGKTTTILRLAKHYVAQGCKVGIITNDQAAGLVDTERFRAVGFTAGEVAGGCFCCRFEDFIARADELIAQSHPDVILAEPVGSCTDLVATVFKPLEQFHRKRFVLAPFTVLVDPMRVLNVLGGAGSARLSQKVTYIFRLQQQEADAIAMNKIDLLTEEQRATVERLLHEHFPNAKLLAFSAMTGEKFDEFVSYLELGRNESHALPDIDYEIYAAGESELGWLNCSAQLRAREAVEADVILLELTHAIQHALRGDGVEIAHAKLLLRSAHNIAVASVVSSTAEPQLSQPSRQKAVSFDLVVNLRAQGEPAVVQQALQRSLDAWLGRNGIEACSISGQAFKPPRPSPTCRIPDAR